MNKKIIVIAFLLLASQFSFAQSPNWSDNIAPVIYSHCSNCHREGGLAPFPLMSFNDVDSNSNDIYNAVLNKVMPPWKADPNYVHFKGEFNLTQQEITDITTWINNGKPTGNLANAPAPPVFQFGSQLPAVDMTLNLPVFVVDSVADQYRTFVVHSNFTTDTYINAIEYVPATIPSYITL